jgi:hypothetical protein
MTDDWTDEVTYELTRLVKKRVAGELRRMADSLDEQQQPAEPKPKQLPEHNQDERRARFRNDLLSKLGRT